MTDETQSPPAMAAPASASETAHQRRAALRSMGEAIDDIIVEALAKGESHRAQLYRTVRPILLAAARAAIVEIERGEPAATAHGALLPAALGTAIAFLAISEVTPGVKMQPEHFTARVQMTIAMAMATFRTPPQSSEVAT